MLFSALPPPPPTPTTLIFALLLAACEGIQPLDSATDAIKTDRAGETESTKEGTNLPVVNATDKPAGTITQIACSVHPDADKVEVPDFCPCIRTELD